MPWTFWHNERVPSLMLWAKLSAALNIGGDNDAFKNTFALATRQVWEKPPRPALVLWKWPRRFGPAVAAVAAAISATFMATAEAAAAAAAAAAAGAMMDQWIERSVDRWKPSQAVKIEELASMGLSRPVLIDQSIHPSIH